MASNRFGDLVRFAIVVAVCASGSLAGAADDCLPLEPRSPHGNYLVPGGRGDIVYRRVSTRDEGAALALDAYRQPGNQRHPAVVVVHGGGGAGSRVSFVGQLIETITAAGYQWVSIDYTPGLANGDRAVDDVIAAVAFVRCHAEALGIQPTRIALLGEDTGADLVTRAAARDPSIAAVVLIGGAFGADVGPRSARSLVIHGAADSEVPLSRGETWCTGKAAASCDLIAVAGASHRVENWHPAQWSYKPRLVDWLHRVLGPGASVSREVVSAGNSDATPFGHGLLKNIPYDAPLGLALDAWLPSSAAPSPAVILVHGGGWEAGDKVTYITPLFEPLARAGFAWFSIDYRLTPAVPHPAQMDDLRHAVAFIRRAREPIPCRSAAPCGDRRVGQWTNGRAPRDRGFAARRRRELLRRLRFLSIRHVADRTIAANPSLRHHLDQCLGRRAAASLLSHQSCASRHAADASGSWNRR